MKPLTLETMEVIEVIGRPICVCYFGTWGTDVFFALRPSAENDHVCLSVESRTKARHEGGPNKTAPRALIDQDSKSKAFQSKPSWPPAFIVSVAMSGAAGCMAQEALGR